MAPGSKSHLEFYDAEIKQWFPVKKPYTDRDSRVHKSKGAARIAVALFLSAETTGTLARIRVTNMRGITTESEYYEATKSKTVRRRKDLKEIHG